MGFFQKASPVFCFRAQASFFMEHRRNATPPRRPKPFYFRGWHPRTHCRANIFYALVVKSFGAPPSHPEVTGHLLADPEAPPMVLGNAQRGPKEAGARLKGTICQQFPEFNRVSRCRLVPRRAAERQQAAIISDRSASSFFPVRAEPCRHCGWFVSG